MTMLNKTAEASHAAGGELIYDHISDSTYLFTYKFYRYCDGISAPSSVNLCGKNTCNASTVSKNMSLLAVIPGQGGNGLPVDPGCAGYPTICTGGNLPGYEEYWYADTVTIPSTCNTWTFYTGISARNPVVNLVGGGNLYTEVKFNNTISHINSSPRFLNKPVPYVCINSPFVFNHQGFDPDGDSLVYFNANPLNGPSSCLSSQSPTNMTYATGYSLTNPIQTAPSGPFTFNNNTGALSFTPSLSGFFAMATRVEEYRGGVKIGSMIRDVQIVVISGCININPGTVIDTINNGNLVGGYIRGCADETLTFCFKIYSPDTAVKFAATSTNGLIIPTSTVTFTGEGTDSLEGCFTWLPTAADVGIHTFTVTARDTSCRPPGIVTSQTFSYPILIPYPVDGQGDVSVCASDSAQLYGVSQVGDSLVWSVLLGDYGSLSCTSCDTTYATPSVTTIYKVEDVNSPCEDNFDTVIVTVLPPPLVDIGIEDSVICQNSSVNLDPTVTPAGAYNYEWTPNVNITSTNTLATTVSPLVDTWYFLEVTEQNAGCTSMDSVFIEVIPLDMVIDDKSPGICLGDNVQLTMSGTAPDSFSYTWSPGTTLNDSTVMSPFASPDTTTVYMVTIEREGCQSYNDFAIVTVEPNPTVDLGVDKVLCQWDTVYINPTIDPSWFTNYSYSWSNTTNLYPPDVADPTVVGNTPGSSSYTLTVSTPLGCFGTDDINITVNPGDFMTVDPTEEEVCSRDSIILEATGGDSYVWTPDLYLSDPNIGNPTSKPRSNVQYTVYGTSAEGCLDTGYVTILLSPAAILEMGEDIDAYDAETIQLNAKGNCSYFSFNPTTFLDDPTISNPTVTGLNTTVTYIVTGYTVNGCATTDTITINYDPGLVIEVPNAFAPNGGESNNTLQIIRRGDFELEYFRIFNRWGENIFETTDIEMGWDGRHNGDLQPIGTYVYDVRGKDKLGQTIHKNGTITLIK